MEGQEHQQTAKEEEEILPAISSLRRCHSDIFKNETMTLVLFFFSIHITIWVAKFRCKALRLEKKPFHFYIHISHLRVFRLTCRGRPGS